MRSLSLVGLQLPIIRCASPVTLILSLLVAVAGVPSRTSAQAPSGGDATRAQLTAAADSIERRALSAGDDRTRLMSEAAAIRQRLAAGDFQVGDRIVISVEGQQALSDTFVVRQDRTVSLAQMPPLPLAGVLHSEAQAQVRSFVGKYVKDATVKVTPLVRVGVIGQVARPGFYSLPTDALLSDVIMQAGGPAPTADLRKTVIRRGAGVYRDAKAFADQLSKGATIAGLGLRSGDEVVVAEVERRHFSETVQIIVGLVSAAAVVLTLSRH